MKFGWAAVIFLMTSVFFTAEAQQHNDRCRWLSVFNEPVQLDSLSVVPGSVSHSGSLPIGVKYESETGFVTITTTEPVDSIRICYRVFPYDLYHEVRNRSPEQEDPADHKNSGKSAAAKIKDQKEELFTSDKIYKSGAISRGISFGNRQDIFVNSVLNLQMEGELSDNLNIRASITDQNIPYQPEGNTKLVQDFDNVFFEIYNQQFSVKAGDIVLNNQRSEFLRFQRNVQGAAINAAYKLFGGSRAGSSMAYSVSKGRFSSHQVEVIDGVMGPYKIYGPNNEAFIIIIANSERVFLDGRLLERGYDHDYVIDYNTAEITFTTRILITKFSRVNIDFEYTNQSYSRSVLNAAHSQKIKDHEISIQFYQEKDNRNQPLSVPLSGEEKYALKDIDPEKTQEAVLSGWDSTGYHESRILYRKIDTIAVDGQPIEVFQVSDHPDSAWYEVSFSETGWGNGDYIRKNISLNGYVFEWAGKLQGNFLPVRIIPLPTQQQMITLRSDITLGQNSLIFNELAFSSLNGNLYNNSLDNRNGFALKSGLALKDKPVFFLPGYYFSGQLDAEYDHQDFTFVDRFRNVEYDRNWSYDPQNDTSRSSDRIFNMSASLKKDPGNYLDFFISRRIKPGMVDGWQGTSATGFDFKHFNLTGDLFVMKNENDFYSSGWLRYFIRSYLKTKYFYPGYQYSVDHNVISPLSSDSVISTAMNYEEHQFFVLNNDSLKTRFNLSYSIRKDRIPQYGEMQDHNLSRTSRLMIGTGRGKFGKFDFSMTYRQLAYLEDSIGEHENSLLGRTDWIIELFKGQVKSETSYAIGNSRELQREYLYIPVPTGEGTHTWRDNNGDGIQDLGEFYLAINPDERNFIKLFMPTDDYILAYDNHLNHRLTADMPRSWRNASGLKGILGKLSVSSFINIQQKINQNDFLDNLFFAGERNDPGRLISYRKNIRNALHFNRANPKFGLDLIYHQMNNKQLISNGFEARDNQQFKFVSRINFSGEYNLRLNLTRSASSSSSDFLQGRNYIIQGREISTIFEWQPTNFWRFSADYSFANNGEPAAEKTAGGVSRINESAFNIKYSRAASKNIDFTIRYIHIDFTGEENTAMGYELLEGLKPGDNLSWSLMWQQKLFDGLQMSLNYEGRKSGDLDVIHTGRMQIMALF
ncbi:MAG: hypothetical protein KFF73_05845 [Cyclobacteriaceae bacterium]|nr:hypothetical protein [Cyclobacteriaceae bacterium]